MVKLDENSQSAQISALMDGECSEAEIDTILSDLIGIDAEPNREAQAQWDHYHLMSDIIRSSDMALHSHTDYVQKVSAKLVFDSISKSMPRLVSRPVKWHRQLTWLSVAAAVGFVSWTIASFNHSDQFDLINFKKSGAELAIATPAPPEWQELLQYHHSIQTAAMAEPMRYIISSVNVEMEPDRASEQPPPSYEWIRLWDQPNEQQTRASVQY